MTPPKPKTKIPNCSGGSEIKTPAAGRQRADFQYQIAPGGARSKRGSSVTNTTGNNTKLLRGERDQNLVPCHPAGPSVIPNCSGGSEIKTMANNARADARKYQIAPGGARSKRRPPAA